MYTNSTARINWNGAFSQSFGIRNGVKQGGILSPVLFCIYNDGLLVRLKQSKIGCLIGNTFVGALAYADDVTLLAPTPSAMRYMFRICEEYSREFCVSFNAAKSASMYCGKKLASCPDGLTFYIDGKAVSYTHLTLPTTPYV